MARLLLVMLALDCWLVMVPHAARYGAGGFNVAHFEWLQRLQPHPSPDLYVGLMLICGSLSLLVALGAMGRLGLALLTTLYTWAWAMSQLDSYQHHYFLTLALCCLLCSPSPRAGESEGGRDWSYRMLLVTVAIVYGFTALSKMEAGWRQGDVLQRIHQSGEALAPALWVGDLVGISGDLFWPVAGHLVVVSQVVILAAYLVAAFASPSRVASVIRWTGWVVTLGFHLGAERANLRVGWFSWYMIVMATVALPPVRWTAGLDRGVSWCGAVLTSRQSQPGRVAVFTGLIAAVIAPLVVVDGLGLPGATTWMVFSFAAVPWVIWSARGVQGLFSWGIVGRSVALLLTVVVLLSGLSSSSVRYDYYRYLGGDTLRRGELGRSHDAYGLANTYAPAGVSRWKKVLRVRQGLREEASRTAPTGGGGR
ncbi:MAG: HTTM domain-containing protein [Myxococcota bacterium]|nr:HTTM domain-containing protein [Myxococcota bacterium]